MTDNLKHTFEIRKDWGWGFTVIIHPNKNSKFFDTFSQLAGFLRLHKDVELAFVEHWTEEDKDKLAYEIGDDKQAHEMMQSIIEGCQRIILQKNIATVIEELREIDSEIWNLFDFLEESEKENNSWED